MDRGAWWATIYDSQRVRHDLSTKLHQQHELLEGKDCVPSQLSPAASMEQTETLEE